MESIKKQIMPTLNWIGKDAVVNHHHDVPFRTLEKEYTFGADDSDNKIIHGDNLEALKALLPEYEGRIKCIYIDPPYNTGNENWVYNDNVNSPKIRKWLGQVVGKEAEDLTRHDKWLCMMYPRLKLLQRLLSDDGAIFISIDDNEQANLKLICDEIFGAGNFVAECIVQSNSSKNNANNVSVTHEYLFVYAKNLEQLPKDWQVKKNNSDEFKKRAKFLFGNNLSLEDIHKELLALVKYPRFFEFDHYTYADERGPFRASDLTAPGSTKYFDIIHPITNKPCKTGTRGWGFSEEEIQRLIKENRILFGENELVVPQLKNHFYEHETSLPKSVLFFDTQNSTKFIKRQGFDFQFPKPVELLEYILQFATNHDSIILDSFAGSGTTAHAVLNLNKQDGGNRKFILVEMENYAEDITAERVRRVIKGYGEDKNAVEGTGGSFSFYELGEPVFNEDGYMNEKIGREKLCEYIWYTETRTPYATAIQPNKYLLGIHQDTSYYFYYEPEKITTLSHDTLNIISEKAETYVVYADQCVIDKEWLSAHNIIFKKIPRDISRF
ncbi:MAG: site-specific DNA-methyltransferase [Bacteroidales bacterium]|nr:site-specific DNA-methyltransferase [Bacteroidales bacterium]